ncbi:MAG: HAD family hydrolase [Atribacterota bacterium]|jgi:hydroxymethylpyrimidine pyrophosphatase-like HAD family hydrolase|nr:HAD family hydrolase [Atribacterota bacterium]
MNPVKTLFFTDLDDTLFQSFPKCKAETESLIPTAYLSNGDPHGFAQPNQVAFLKHMASFATVIPTTARNFDSYSRVRLPIDPPPYVILNHGGTILDQNGELVSHWADQMNQVMLPWLDALTALQSEITQWSEKDEVTTHARVIGDFEQEFYVLVKDRQKNTELYLERLRTEWLDEWVAALPGLSIHQNGNNLTVQPDCLDKAFAVNFLIDQYREDGIDLLIIGAGDSKSDAGFLSLCDYAMIPKNAQLNPGRGY